MSLNQSRAEKSEHQQHTKRSGRSGTSGHQRSFTGGGGGKGGGRPTTTTAPPPHPSASFGPSRSFKRSSGNGQGGQSRVTATEAGIPAVPSAATTASADPRVVQNGVFVQRAPPGASDRLPPNKPMDSVGPRGGQTPSKAPQLHTSSGVPNAPVPTTPPKGDASSAFTLQFGSISPGFVDGMQIPARTSSAPPNLDEQKRDQARQDFIRAVPAVPIPAAPKQQPRNDSGGVNQTNTGEPHPTPTQIKREMHIQSSGPPPPAAVSKPSILPMDGMPMPIPFQPPLVPVQFGGHAPQMSSQGVSVGPLQTHIPFSMGSTPQVPQQMFAPGLQSHPLQPQGMMHQGQALSFAPQMTHQPTPHVGNLGIGLSPQYPQRPAGKFGGAHKVKITHPDTHEEVKLDTGSSGPRQHSNVPSQSQPTPSFTHAHQIGYYSRSYNPPPIYFSAPTSLPLTSTQMATGSQAPIYNYPGSRSGQPVTFINPSVVPPLPSSKPGTLMPGISEPTYLDMKAVSAPSGPAQVTGKLAGGIHTDKILTPSLTVGMPLSKSEPVKLSKPLGDSSNNSNLQRSSKGGGESLIQQGKLLPESSLPVLAKHSTTVPAVVSVQRTNPDICLPVSVNPVEDLVSVASNVEGRRREPVRRSESFKDHPKKPSKKDAQPQPHSQADATESTGGSKLSSIKIPKDNDTAQANAKHVTRSPALMRNSSGDGETSISFVNLPSPREQGDPYAAGTFQPDDVKSVHPPSSPSVVTLEADASGQIQIEHSDSRREVGVACRDVEKVHCQAPIPTVSVVAETISRDAAASRYPNEDDSSIQEAVVEREFSGTTEQMIAESPDGYVAGPCDSKLHIAPIVSEPSEGVKKVDSIPEMVGGELEKSVLVNEFGPAENAQTDAKQEVVRSCSDAVLPSQEAVPSTAFSDAELIPSDDSLSTDIHANKDKVSFAMNSISSTMSIQKEEADLRSSPPFPKKEPTASPLSSVVAQKHEGSGSDLSSGSLVSTSPAGPKPPMDFVRSKSISGKKKKKKEYLSKADAAGYTSDLYLAYKSPAEKQETVSIVETVDCSTVDAKQVFANDTAEDATVNEEDGKSRSEFDDWEDAADTAKLRTLENGQPFPIAKRHNGYESEGASKKKYSRDFLLKFLEQCTELPVDFDIRSAMEDSLISVQVGAYHNGYPSPGRISDRPSPRVDRRGSGMSDDDKWSKGSISFVPMRDPRVEAGYGGPNAGFRSGQGVGHGVLRNPRGHSTNQYNGGIMLGPAQSSMHPGGISRNNMDGDRWQRGTAIQRGLIASPLTPLQVMHKADKKYEVGKVSDEEEAKQRQLKGILNKLTPQNFDKLFEKVKDVNIDNAVTLRGVISQIFDKALTEPTFCEMYADFCCQLASALPDFVEDNEKITFRRVLLNKCQEEFERGEREEAEANRIEEEGEIKSSVEEREAKKVNARRRMLGNIRLIGELYKKRMLTERIMHECIKKLLGEYQNPDEEDVEALCKLMSTIGEMIDHPKAKDHIDSYFNTMHALSTNQKLSSRVRFMLRDAIDLRKNKWQQRRKVEGPKKIEEVHRDAAQERQLQTSRLARGPSMNSSARRGPPGDYGSRISTVLPSPTSQSVGGFRALSPQVRGQDVRFEDGHLYENKTLSVPLPQRLIHEDSITLGPQGGLARGMSMRGQSQMPSVPLAALGPNGYGPQSGWTPYGPKAEPMPKPMPDRSSGTSYDQLNPQAHSTTFDNRDLSNADRAFDRSIASTPPGGRPQGSSLGTQNVLPDTKALSEESLREKSISAIREFYSAKDEEEVALCMKELNSPGFYPSMVSLWVTDSFERKDIERDLLAKLLITLCKSQVSLLRQVQLIQGFESVLSTLEDAINDAPKAAEFLGRIFGKMIIENVITLGEIGKIVREGGEEPGRLLEIGIASDVLGSVLEIIKLEKGESALNEIRASSNLHLEDFRPPHPIKSVKLDAFI